MPTTQRTTDVDVEDTNPRLNALLGAVVTLVTSPLLPLAPIVGGGLAGYLQDTDMREGALVGALSGAIAAIPVFLGVWFVGGYLFMGGVHLFQIASVFTFLVFVVVFGTLLALGALGGALGTYLRSEL